MAKVRAKMRSTSRPRPARRALVVDGGAHAGAEPRAFEAEVEEEGDEKRGGDQEHAVDAEALAGDLDRAAQEGGELDRLLARAEEVSGGGGGDEDEAYGE